LTLLIENLAVDFAMAVADTALAAIPAPALRIERRLTLLDSVMLVSPCKWIGFHDRGYTPRIDSLVRLILPEIPTVLESGEELLDHRMFDGMRVFIMFQISFGYVSSVK
jgi:hypothetical protein